MLAALRKPELVTHLVLSATSGGMRMADLDAQDWRPAVRAETVPSQARWRNAIL